MQLDGYLVASVDAGVQIVAWRAATGEVVGRWQLLAQLSAALRVRAGRLVVVRHCSGKQFQVTQHVEDAHDGGVEQMALHGDLLVSCSESNKVKLWDPGGGSRSFICTLHHKN